MQHRRYNGHLPPEIIAQCVWLYHRFPLSFREVEELMLHRGVVVSYETIRAWCAKCPGRPTQSAAPSWSRPGDRWHLDKVFIEINGTIHYLWRAVDRRYADDRECPGASLSVGTPLRNESVRHPPWRCHFHSSRRPPRWATSSRLRRSRGRGLRQLRAPLLIGLILTAALLRPAVVTAIRVPLGSAVAFVIAVALGSCAAATLVRFALVAVVFR